MSQFKDKIPAAGGTIEFIHNPVNGRLDIKISGFGFIAMYMIAVSMDGRHYLGTVPATGIGQTPIYPQPSVVTYIQSDEQGMWGRNCPVCEKYFRTNHVMDVACCPYCSAEAPSLDFISRDQRTYITACYDAFARAYIGKKSTSVDEADITDSRPAWHYSEEKQQVHFTCDGENCHTQTDILGLYGYCPRCGRTSARKLFMEQFDKMLSRWELTKNTVTDRHERGEIWEEMTTAAVSDFEALAKHLRLRLLRLPMTPKRKKKLEGLSFQQPLVADQLLTQWFDIGFMEWPGDNASPKRVVPATDLALIRKMLQKRHILTHNRGLVDQDYLDLSGDSSVQLNERISVSSKESKRFIESVRVMAENLLDNIEYGFREA